MGLTFTRSEFRTLIGQIIRDSSNGLHSAAKKNRILNRVVRDFIERTECSRNVLVFSVASAAADGVIVYDKTARTPTITRVPVGDRNYYTISGCDLIDKISRWDDDDGGWKELAPKSQYEIDSEGLLLTTDTVPVGYQQLDTPGTFQILPELASSGYTYSFEVRYREASRDLITYDGSPTDSTVVQTTGFGLSDITAAVTNVTIPCKFRITVLTAATPDTVKTEKDIYDGNGWVTVTASAALTGAAQTLAHGATYTAAATTGHTAADIFEFAVDDLLVPSVPLLYRDAIVDGVIGELLRIERDPEWQSYTAKYEIAVQRLKAKARRLNSDQGSRFRSDYMGGGG